MTAINTRNSFSSLVKVFENSEVRIFDSTFERNFGLSKGSVISGDYQRAKIEIFNSTFRENAGAEGGVFYSEDHSFLSCNNCTIEKNFAVVGGVFLAHKNGFFRFEDSSIT